MRYRLSPISLREITTGVVIGSATVTVYKAGGSVLATCYADTTTATPLTGSQTTTTSSGYFEFYLDSADYRATQKFKIVISKAGYSDVTYDQLSVIQDINTELNLLDFLPYGYVTNGSVDYSTQLQNGINTLKNMTLGKGGRLILPLGHWSIGNGATGIETFEGIEIYGQGKPEYVNNLVAGGTWLIYSGTGDAIKINGEAVGFDSRRSISLDGFGLKLSGANAGINADFMTQYQIRDLNIRGTATYGVYMRNCYNGIISRLKCEGMTNGLYFDVKPKISVTSLTRSGSTATAVTASAHGVVTGQSIKITGADQSEYNVSAAVATVVNSTTFTYPVSGSPATPATGTIYFDPSVFSGQTLFESCDFWECTGKGVHLSAQANVLAQMVFLKSHFRSNIYGTYLEGPNLHKVNFLGCHWEANTTTDAYIHSDVTRGPLIQGCYFNTATATWKIDCQGDTAAILDNEFIGSLTGWGVNINGDDNRIEGNYFYENLANNVVVIGTSANRTLVGKQVFSNSSGRVIDNSTSVNTIYGGETILLSKEFTLSAAAETEASIFTSRDYWIADARIIYPVATSADAGVKVRFGNSGDAVAYINHTSNINMVAYQTAIPTLVATYIAQGTRLTFSCAGGKTGAGTAKVMVRCIPFPIS